jgi:hypothetical protein
LVEDLVELVEDLVELVEDLVELVEDLVELVEDLVWWRINWIKWFFFITFHSTSWITEFVM